MPISEERDEERKRRRRKNWRRFIDW